MSGGPDISTWPARMGVMPGDTIQLMADLTRMAWNARRAGERFSAHDLLNAFADAVGQTGTVLVPSYNFDLRDGDAFDVRHTRSISGALANAAIDHPRFRRTPHPLHSFAVAGAGTEELMRSTENSSFGPASPFAFLLRHKATLIAIDLPLNDSLTFVHFTEEQVGVPYRSHRTVRFRYTGLDGTIDGRTFSVYAKGPGHHMDLTPLEALLVKAGALAYGEVDGSCFLQADLSRAHELIAHDITTNKARSIHLFRWSWWIRDHMKALLRTFGIRSRKERTAHAARTA